LLAAGIYGIFLTPGRPFAQERKLSEIA